MSDASATSLQIALVIHALKGGGAERLMSQLASRWAAAGHRVQLITLAAVASDSYPVDARVVRHGLDLQRDSQNRLQGAIANVQRVRRLRDLLRRLSPQFILSFCDRMNIVTASAARGLHVPLWLSEHSDPRKQSLGPVWEAWRSRAYRSATGCIVLTDPIARWMHKRFPGLPVKVIPPAISPPPSISQAASQTQQHITASGDKRKRLLALGRHSAEKNFSGLLRAWQTVAAEFPQWQLVVAGDGPLHGQLLRDSQALNLGDSVQFTGWVSDAWSLMAACDALVLPSIYEGFPVTLLEAMAVGLPCVSTQASDAVNDLAAVGAVLMARSPDPADLAAALRNLLGSPERKVALSLAARAAAANYLWTEIGPMWDRLLEEGLPPVAGRATTV